MLIGRDVCLPRGSGEAGAGPPVWGLLPPSYGSPPHQPGWRGASPRLCLDSPALFQSWRAPDWLCPEALA